MVIPLREVRRQAKASPHVVACRNRTLPFHDLRHTACSHMAMNGASQGELMEILGHRSPRMTVRYRHYSKKHIASVMERTQANLLDLFRN